MELNISNSVLESLKPALQKVVGDITVSLSSSSHTSIDQCSICTSTVAFQLPVKMTRPKISPSKAQFIRQERKIRPKTTVSYTGSSFSEKKKQPLVRRVHKLSRSVALVTAPS